TWSSNPADNNDKGTDPAFNPTLAVDSNLPALLPNPANPANKVSFIDPTTGATQADFLANNHINPATRLPNPNFDQIYVAWNQQNKLPTGGTVPPLNQHVIRLTTSADGGNQFSFPVTVNNGDQDGTPFGYNVADPQFPNVDKSASPVLTIAQGTSSDRSST